LGRPSDRRHSREVLSVRHAVLRNWVLPIAIIGTLAATLLAGAVHLGLLWFWDLHGFHSTLRPPSASPSADRAYDVTPLSLGAQLRLLRLPEEFRSEYPSKELVGVDFHIVDRIELHSTGHDTIKAGGFYSPTRVVVSVPSKGVRKPELYLHGQLHSEFSSILIARHGLPEDEWTSCRGALPYLPEMRTELLQMPGSARLRPQLATKTGLLTPYSRVSVEEDFNMMVLHAFWSPRRLLRLSRTSPCVRMKLQIMTRFYQRLGARWTVQDNVSKSG
jgi:hypothetical protein